MCCKEITENERTGMYCVNWIHYKDTVILVHVCIIIYLI